MRSIKAIAQAMGRWALLMGMLAMCGGELAAAAQSTGDLSNSLFALQMRRAEQGDREAQFGVAERLREGRGVNRDLAGSLRWYRAAAEAGHAAAAFRVGECYERGLGVPKDPTVAFQWYERAAKGGNADARAKLAERTAREQAEQKAQEKAARDAKERAAREAQQRAAQAQAAQKQRQTQEQMREQVQEHVQAPVAAKQPVQQRAPGEVLASLRKDHWNYNGKPSEFLPSVRASCLPQGENALVCFTPEMVARVGDRQLRYLVKSEVQATPQGGVRIRYRHYVLRLREAKGDEAPYAGPQAPALQEGWQEPPLELNCEPPDAGMKCMDSNKTVLAFTRGQP